MTVSSQATPTGRTSPDRPQQQWFVVGRWSEYEGEARTNLLRIVAIGVFYAIELSSYYGLHLGWLSIDQAVDRAFHIVMTAIAVAWALIALVTQLCLHAKIFSSALKYITTTCDMALLTLVVLAGDGPRSAMLVGFFLIIALATLRLRIRLMWYATLGSQLGYLTILCCARWYPPAERDLSVPRYEQLIMLAAIAIEGVILGQVVRQVGRRSPAGWGRLAGHGHGSEPLRKVAVERMPAEDFWRSPHFVPRRLSIASCRPETSQPRWIRKIARACSLRRPSGVSFEPCIAPR